jgi:hypothetical protein
MIRDFLYDRMNDWKLPIRDIIEKIGEEPVFIIAKTGVGKTVTVPTKILLGLCDKLLASGADLTKKFPQVYVVEPRIPICTMTMAEMNEGYQNYVAYRMIDYPEFQEFLNNQGVQEIESKDQQTVSRIVDLAYRFVEIGKAAYNPRHFNLYGCITSATGKINADAPILFVTTGIMESLTFEGTKLNPEYHRIIIDEAHVTIEANPAIELGIALARKANINIDYMSATVDPATLEDDLGAKIVYAEAQRFPIHLTNLNATVEESILDLVQNFLLEPDESRFPKPNDFANPEMRNKVERVRLHLLSLDDFQDNGKGYLGLKNRPQGMLVIVNSHQSENSDTFRITDLIARAGFNKGKVRVHTLRLASPVVRDPEQKLAFDRLIKNIEDENGRYVIVATNVVEMGLTFSSLDYVVTMDSEFNNVFEDGAQMTKKDELGVNALYQRIGRAGRVRPGMAFIARDFGASYCSLDDEKLAEGLKEAPIHYPLAKGSFLKLALYSFRERMPEQELFQRIEALNLPSRIQNNQELWSRFIAERNRLRKIGIAKGDKLSFAGEASLGFIGLDDMDFAFLLATVVERFGNQSDLAVVYTVLAAANETGFSDLMERKFTLVNSKQLSAVEIFHEDALGISVPEAIDIIKQHEYEGGDLALFEALRESGVDDQICSDICSFVRAGYKLNLDNSYLKSSSSENIINETREGDLKDEYLLDDNWDEIVEDQEDGLSEELRHELNQYSIEHTIAFERSVVSFSDLSELINIYRIYRHFFNTYLTNLKSGHLSSLEKYELRKSMEEEARKLQISIRSVYELDKRFNKLARHVNFKLARKEPLLKSNVKLDENEQQLLLESIIRDLLYEREGNEEKFDLCLRFYKLTEEHGKFSLNSPQNVDGVIEQLGKFGFDITRQEVKELWNLIIENTKQEFNLQHKLFNLKEGPEILPPLSKGLERDLLRIIREFGYHRKLSFRRGDFGFTTTVQDQFGVDIEIKLDEENNPMKTTFQGKEKIVVFAKLTPKMQPKDIRDDENDGNFIKEDIKVFKLSHVTFIN